MTAPSSRKAKVVGAVVIAVVAAQLTSQAARGAVIRWGAPQGISADTDVSTAGSLIGAFNVGAPGVPSTTVNGVNFVGFGVPGGTTATSGDFTFASAAGIGGHNGQTTANPPFSALSPAYQTLLASYNDTGGAPFTLTMSGLSSGGSYQFEWWTNTSPTSAVETTATAGSSVVLNSNTPNTIGGVGQFAIGAFVADATAQETITFFGPGTTAVLIDAFELRELPASPSPISEPASIDLLGVGLAGLLALVLRKRQLRLSSH